MRDEVQVTLNALELPDKHRAAGALSLVYADQLDSAAAAERAADFVLAAAIREGVDEDVQELIQTLRAKLAARSTIANIGPRLAELLGRLLATPKDAGVTADKPEPLRPAKTGSLAMLRGGKTG